MEKEVIALLQVARKAAGKPVDEQKCVKALSRLKCIPISLQLLDVSNAGNVVYSLSKHSCKQIQSLASDVKYTWIRQLMKSTSNSSSVKADNSQVQQLTKKFAPNSSSVKAAKAEVQRKSKKSAPNSSSVKAAKTEVQEGSCQNQVFQVQNIPKCNDLKRNKIREQIFEALCLVFDESKGKEDIPSQVSSCNPIAVADSVESSLFGKWGSANLHKYRSLLFNIKDPRNPDFRRKVLLGEIKADQVSELSAAEMASEERRDENENIKARGLMKCIVNKKDEVEFTTTEFKCGKCGMRKTTYYQIQTRSADEPMTTFVTCTNCHNRWKFC